MRQIGLLAFAIFALLSSATPASAVDFGVGLAAVDSMDDRAHPAASARVGWTKELYSQAYYWGQDFGPVSERNAILTLAREAPIKGASILSAHYGMALSRHEINLYANDESKAQPEAPEPAHDSEYNVGGIVGLGARFKTGPLTYSFNWDSHIFLTGSPFVVFLTSARKQTVSLMLGVEL